MFLEFDMPRLYKMWYATIYTRICTSTSTMKTTEYMDIDEIRAGNTSGFQYRMMHVVLMRRKYAVYNRWGKVNE